MKLIPNKAAYAIAAALAAGLYAFGIYSIVHNSTPKDIARKLEHQVTQTNNDNSANKDLSNLNPIAGNATIDQESQTLLKPPSQYNAYNENSDTESNKISVQDFSQTLKTCLPPLDTKQKYQLCGVYNLRSVMTNIDWLNSILLNQTMLGKLIQGLPNYQPQQSSQNLNNFINEPNVNKWAINNFKQLLENDYKTLYFNYPFTKGTYTAETVQSLSFIGQYKNLVNFNHQIRIVSFTGAKALPQDNDFYIDLATKQRVSIYDLWTVPLNVITPILKDSLALELCKVLNGEAINDFANAGLSASISSNSLDNGLSCNTMQDYLLKKFKVSAIPLPENFLFTSKGLSFKFAPYELSSEIDSTLKIVVPYSNIFKYLKRYYLQQFARLIPIQTTPGYYFNSSSLDKLNLDDNQQNNVEVKFAE